MDASNDYYCKMKALFASRLISHVQFKLMIMVMIAVLNYCNNDPNNDNYRVLHSGMKI